MRCSRCGSTINDHAQFCTVCGAAVSGEKADSAAAGSAKSENSAAVGNVTSGDGEATGGATSADSATADGADETAGLGAMAAHSADAALATPSGDAEAHPAVSTFAPIDPSTATVSQYKSFGAALDEARARSKRRVPVFVIVALALVLTAGVAFAAYQVYNAFFAPEQTQEQSAASDEVGGTADSGSVASSGNAAGTPPSTTSSSDTANPSAPDEPADAVQAPSTPEQAQTAYDGVIAEYEHAIDNVLHDGSYYRRASSADVPHVYTDKLSWLASENDTIETATGARENGTRIIYTQHDLNDDGIDELIIAYGTDGGTYSDEPFPFRDDAVGVALVDLYTFYDGEARRINVNHGTADDNVIGALCANGMIAAFPHVLEDNRFYYLGADPRSTLLACTSKVTMNPDEATYCHVTVTRSNGTVREYDHEFVPEGDLLDQLTWHEL